jgi:hypothetical protein
MHPFMMPLFAIFGPHKPVPHASSPPPRPLPLHPPPAVDYFSRAVAEQLRRDWNRRRYRLGALNCSTHTHPGCPPTGALGGGGEVETRRRYSRYSLACHMLCVCARSQSSASPSERVVCVSVCVPRYICVCVFACVRVCVRASSARRDTHPNSSLKCFNID